MNIEEVGKTPQEELEQEEEELLNPAKLFRLVAKIKREAPPVEPLWGNFLFKKGITLVVGDPGVCKTTFGYGLCGALCMGEPFLEIVPEEQVKVLYMDWESADSLIAARMNLVFGDKEPAFHVYNSVDWFFPQIMDLASTFCREKRINLVIIDNQTTAFSTRDENDNSEAAKQMRYVRKFANMVNCAILLFHHTSKANLLGTRKGTGAFARARLADVCLNIVIPDENNKDIIKLEMVKNRQTDEEKVDWFIKRTEGKFEFIDLPAGVIGGERPNTEIYKVCVEVINVLSNGVNPEGIRFQELVQEMSTKGYNESWVDNAVRRLIKQNRVWRPKYGYCAIRKI